VHIDAGSYIHENTGATEGGGIRCAGGKVTLAGDVAGNQATRGGGIYAGANCGLALGSALGDGVSIYFNTSTDGGGLYVTGESFVHGDGDAGNGLYIWYNVATGSGGGVYAEGTDTEVTLENTWVRENEADAGAGLLAALGAHVIMDRVSGHCTDTYRCSWLGQSHGTAALAESGAELDLYQTVIDETDLNLGAALVADGATTVMKLESSVIVNNGVLTILRVSDHATATIAFTSMAGNRYYFGGAFYSHLLDASGNAGAALLSSVLWHIGASNIDSGSPITADCILTDLPSDLPASATVQATADPRFEDEAGGDLHLLHDSPALDFCDTRLYVPTQADVDNDTRPYDFAPELDVFGPYDIGADEVVMLKIAGFEPGNLAEFNAHLPP